MRRVESLLAVLSLLPGLALAQNGSIRGRVTDATRAPLSRATISAEAAGLRATSDEGTLRDSRRRGRHLHPARAAARLRATVGEGDGRPERRDAGLHAGRAGD